MDGNSSRETGSNMNYLQREQLVQFVEENYSGLFETVSDDPVHTRLWSLITQKLNELGPVKNVQGWKRCFTCLKSTAKAKLCKANAKQSINNRLNEIEKRIVKIFKMDQLDRLRPEQNQIAPLNVSSRFPESKIDIPDNCSSAIDKAHSDETVMSIASQALLPPDTEMTFSHHGGMQFIPQSQNEHGNKTSGSTMFCESSNLNLATNQQQEVSMEVQIVSTSTPVLMEVIQQPQNKRSYSNAAQRQKLVTLVKQNYSALFGRVSNRLHADLLKAKIWKLIAVQLNSIGPAKNVEGWKRCLNTLKDLTKKKKTANRQGKTNVQLTALEKEIDKTFKTLDGSEKLHELGLKQKVKRAPFPGEALRSNSNYLSQQPPTTSCVTSTVTSTITPNQMASSNSVTENRSNQVYPQLQSQIEAHPSMVLPGLGIGATAENNTPEFNKMELDSSMILPEETTSTVQHSQRARVTATVTSTITSNEMPSSHPNSVLENTSNQVDPQLQSQNEAYPSMVLPELGIGATAKNNMPEFNEMELDSSMILPEETTSNVQFPQPPGVAVIISNQQVVPPIADRLQDQSENVSAGTEEIRPLGEERPQRRGVEINLNRYIQPYHYGDSDDDGHIMPPRGRASRGRVRRTSDPRRVRLTVPLGVMAAQSLQLQRRTNALLNELLFEIRNAGNRGYLN